MKTLERACGQPTYCFVHHRGSSATALRLHHPESHLHHTMQMQAQSADWPCLRVHGGLASRRMSVPWPHSPGKLIWPACARCPLPTHLAFWGDDGLGIQQYTAVHLTRHPPPLSTAIVRSQNPARRKRWTLPANALLHGWSSALLAVQVLQQRAQQVVPVERVRALQAPAFIRLLSSFVSCLHCSAAHEAEMSRMLCSTGHWWTML